MNILLLVFLIAAVLFLLLFFYSACRLASECDRHTEELFEKMMAEKNASACEGADV